MFRLLQLPTVKSGIECNFYIKIYSQEELEEIKQKIQKELGQLPKVNKNMLQLMKERYRISSKDLRSILDVNYIKYRDVEEKDKYLKLTWNKEENEKTKEKKAEIIKKWKCKDTITYKGIKNVQEKYELTLEEVLEILGISKKVFKQLEAKKEKKIKINLYSENEKQECRKKISNQKKYKVSKKVIEQIAKEEKISVEKAGEILGIKQETLKKIIEEKQSTIKLKDKKIEEKVDKLALDLKYIEGNGERYYKEEELYLMSIMYEISIDDLIYYLAKGRTMYNTYQEGLKNNPNGVWIGGKTRLSNQYIEENYDILNYYLNQNIQNIACQYKINYHDRQDLKSEAFEYMLRNCGIYEKNLFHDSKKLNGTLMKNIPYIMKNYCKKMSKELPLTLIYEGKEYENPEALLDNTYNPEICCLQEEYSYLKEIDPLHSKIVKDIKANLSFAMDYPKKCFTRLANKYNMTEEMFEETLSEIRFFIVESGLVKIDKNGKVISMFDIYEENKIEN